MTNALPWLEGRVLTAPDDGIPRPQTRLGMPTPVSRDRDRENAEEDFELVVPPEISYLRQLAEQEGQNLGERDFILLTSSSLLGAMGKDERVLRTTFVQEYLHDYDPVAAATRCGYSDIRDGLQPSVAQRAAKKLMAEPVVQRLIKEYTVSMAQELDPNRVRALILREANNYSHTGSAAARQNSQKLLAEVANITGKKGPEDDPRLRGGIMAIPARLGSDAQWEQVAMESQRLLKESVGA